MNKYELALVISSKVEEEAKLETLEKAKALIERFGGVITDVDDWGKRKLAYLINDEAEGYYVVINFNAETTFVAELERIAKITDGVLRTITVRK